jgi:hypothetical protein
MLNVKHNSESANNQQAKNQAAIALLDEWLADESGYENDNAEAIERALAAINDNPLSLREPSSK